MSYLEAMAQVLAALATFGWWIGLPFGLLFSPMFWMDRRDVDHWPFWSAWFAGMFLYASAVVWAANNDTSLNWNQQVHEYFSRPKPQQHKLIEDER